MELTREGKPKTPQQRYLEKVVEEVPCACGCGGMVQRRKLHYFPSHLKKTGGRLPRLILGHHDAETREALLRGVKKSADNKRGKRGQGTAHWKGGKTVSKAGYVYIRVGDEYKAEHRLVAEEMIGRPLHDNEEVHHIDHNKKNNVPSNLVVMTSSEHGVEHNKERPRNGQGRYIGGKSHGC